MIRHDHIFIHRQMVIKCIHLPDIFVSDFSIGQQFRAWCLLQSDDPVVRGFLSWYGDRTEQEKKEICRYVLEFAEKIKPSR